MSILLCALYQQSRSLYVSSERGDLVKAQELVGRGANALWRNPDDYQVSPFLFLVLLVLCPVILH